MTHPASEQQRTAGFAGLIGLTAFGGAVVGFFLQLLVAYYFGASANTDAYFMALSTSELLGKLLLGGSITAVFLPMFVERLSRGQRTEAWQLALNLLHITAAIFIVALIALGLFTRPFVQFIAPGFDADTTQLTIGLIRVMLPAFLLYFLSDMAVAMLHSLKVFTIPALLRVIAPLVTISTILLFVRTIGIYSLAVGATLGSLLQLLFVGWGLWRQGFRYSFVWQPKSQELRRLLYLVYPFIFSALATQGAGIVYRVLVSELSPGSLSALKYAEKITQLLTIIFLNSVTTVIYPLLAEKASRRDVAGARDTIGSAVRLTTFLTLPLIIAVAFLREPIVRLIYQRGSFTEEDVAFTSIALLFLVVGLTTNALSSILGHATLALQHTRGAVAVTIASHAVAIILFVLLVPRMAHAGLALASSLVPLSSSLLYYLFLSRYIPRLSLIFWHGSLLKIAALSVALAAALAFIMPILASAFSVSLASNIITLAVAGGLGIAIFFGGAYALRLQEMHDVLAIAARVTRKWRGVY